MSFWDAFNAGNEAAIESMGEPEPVTIDGQPCQAVVLPLTQEGGMMPGGKRKGLACQLFVSLELVTPRDGMPVVARGENGRVNSWEKISATWVMLDCGPENRWDGEIPGA